MSSSTPKGVSNDARLQSQEKFPAFPGLDETASLDSDDVVPPPAYGDTYGKIQSEGDDVGTNAAVTDDGRVNIRVNQKTKGLSSLLVPALRSQLDLLSTAGDQGKPPLYHPPTIQTQPVDQHTPRLNIVIQVVGSRGDVQPFVALGKVLKEKFNHRVRLATHPVFQSFVEDNGLEFFSIAGDPAELMAFMVKNPGLMPGFDTLRSGDVGRRRKEIAKMIKGCWRSCIEPGTGFGIEASDSNIDEWLASESASSTEQKDKPFVADAIIANPPSFAHVHCAEKLGIPLHMMFTMPWSPTQAFPHPLANITSTNADLRMTNFVSYALVDMMTWQGLGDVINRFRQRTLGLEPISPTWAPGMLARMKIPWTYCWSPALIPKPRDWGSHISISGFFFLSLGSNFVPDPDLAAFLDNGPPPVYIGFGSIVVDDPDAMTQMIFDAVKKSGQRALVSKGWGGFGAEQIGIPDGVFMLGNVPHDWLFERVSCVVHHGGAGTTAIGIKCAKPTVIVPFFGDQPFWGTMTYKAGAGPAPIPYKQLTADKLAEAITQALKPDSIQKAKELSEKISQETGTVTGAQSFHGQLDLDKMRCILSPKRVAVWRIKRTSIRLSAFVVAVLANENLLKPNDVKLYRPQEHHTEDEPFDPISGGASALVETMGSMAMGIADFPVSALKALKIHPEKSRSRSQSKEEPKATDKQEPSSPPPQAASGESNQDENVASPTSISRQTTATSAKNPTTSQSPEAANQIINQMAASAPQAESQTSHSRPNSPPSTQSAQNNGKSSPKFSVDDAIDTGKGVSRFVGAGIKSPMDFTLALARGFHNAPKLYGDETVRKSEKITGLSSGLRAAGKEFGYGFMDGITGLVTQPVEGAKKEGFGGFLKGVGMGIGGLMLKPGAAVWGLPGYTAAGIYKELKKRFGPSAENWIVASRTAQGYDELQNSTEEERRAIIDRWNELKPYIRKKKSFAEEQHENLSAMRERTASAVSRSISPNPVKSDEIKGISRTDTNITEGSSVWTPTSERQNPLSRADTGLSQGSRHTSDNKDLEEAIKRSVADTSKGNAEEDAAIEQAIRTSVAELENHREHGMDDKRLQKLMESSIEQANKGLPPRQTDYDDSGFATESESGDAEDDHELNLAIEESKKAFENKKSADEKAQQEEEIVIQYMLKQSKAEEEMKSKASQ